MGKDCSVEFCRRCGVHFRGTPAKFEDRERGIWRCLDLFEECFDRMLDRDMAELQRLPGWPQPTHTFPEAMATLPRHLAPP